MPTQRWKKKRQAAPQKKKKTTTTFPPLCSSSSTSPALNSPALRFWSWRGRRHGRRGELLRIRSGFRIGGAEEDERTRRERERASEQEKKKLERLSSLLLSLSFAGLFHRFNVPAPLRVEPARPRTGRVAARAMAIGRKVGRRRRSSRRKRERRDVSTKEKSRKCTEFFFFFFFAFGSLQLAHKKQILFRGVLPLFRGILPLPQAAFNPRRGAAATT